MVRLVLVVACLAVAGCSQAPKRYLTAEQDEEMRQNCEPHGGCVVVPVPLWAQIEALVNRMLRQQGSRI